ncbi:MAG: hypothetical protein JWO02_1845 [Solirubrobacterales bacterium]|nr:hypothetical protein [Solirubrobacterales bacterium]
MPTTGPVDVPMAPATTDATAAKSASGSGTGGATGSPGTAADDLGNRVAILQFGTAPKKLRDDIVTALTQAGLQVIFNGIATQKRLQTFLASPLAELFSAKGDEPVGKAFGAQLVNVTPAARRAFPVLFGPKTPFVPVIRAVLTRRDALTDGQVDFHIGVTKGLKSTDIPLAYVERSDRKTPSLVKTYQKLGVLTVDDLDTQAGKQRLGGIMLGTITTQQAVDAINVEPTSQLTGTAGDSPGAAPWIILALLGGGAVFFVTGGLRRRGRRAA